MRDQMWILAELMILAITEYVLLMPVHGQPVWNNPGSKACDTLYPNAQKGYVILKWQFQSSSEPAEINWKFGSTFIMEKYAGSPASGLNGYDVSYITGEEGCGDEKQSGCILLNGTSEADVGTYYIDVTADGTTIFDSGELTFNHDFNEVNASSILNNNCNLQLGDQNYTLAQSEISLSQAMTTVVSLQWDCSAVPAAKKYVTHNGATTPCSDILTTECQTAPIELTDGDLKIIFDYSETWNPEFSIQINTPDLCQLDCGNNGVCELDVNNNPGCKCTDGYFGSKCSAIAVKRSCLERPECIGPAAGCSILIVIIIGAVTIIVIIKCPNKDKKKSHHVVEEASNETGSGSEHTIVTSSGVVVQKSQDVQDLESPKQRVPANETKHTPRLAPIPGSDIKQNTGPMPLPSIPPESLEHGAPFQNQVSPENGLDNVTESNETQSKKRKKNKKKHKKRDQERLNNETEHLEVIDK